MRKFLNYFLSFFAFASILFLASCSDEDDPGVGDLIINLTPSDDVAATPGDTVTINVDVTGADDDTQVRVVSNPAGEFIPANGMIAAGDSVQFIVPNDAIVGETYTLTFTIEGSDVNEQLDINVENGSIADIVLRNENFSILATALTESGFLSTLDGTGPYTVFAPTDSAFEAAGITAANLPEGDALTAFLNYHVINGSVLAEDLEDEDGRIATLEGSDIMVSTEDGYMINDAMITSEDIEATNGVIHLIDKPLMPAYSISTATAVLLGGQLNVTYGSFYGVVEDSVFNSAGAQGNPELIDLVYYYSTEGTTPNNATIASPDNDLADAAFVNTDLSQFPNATRFKATDLTTAQFDAIASQSDLEDGYSTDTEAGDDIMPNLAVGQVFGFMLDEERGGNIGLIKVVSIEGTVGNNRTITLDVKYVK